MNPLEELNELTEEMVIAKEEVEYLEAHLKEAKAKHQMLQEDLLPDAMRTMGQDLLKLSNGKYLELVDLNTARIPKSGKEAAYEYLESIGEGGMIKRQVVCEFRKDQEEWAHDALNALHAAGFGHAYADRTHAWNTFQKWVDDQFEAGKSLPKDILGIYTRTVARIKK